MGVYICHSFLFSFFSFDFHSSELLIIMLDFTFRLNESCVVSWQKLSPEQVYHVVVAPCFDKKLEAVREEFYSSLLQTRDVDCVLTSGKKKSRKLCCSSKPKNVRRTLIPLSH